MIKKIHQPRGNLTGFTSVWEQRWEEGRIIGRSGRKDTWDTCVCVFVFECVSETRSNYVPNDATAEIINKDMCSNTYIQAILLPSLVSLKSQMTRGWVNDNRTITLKK